MITDLYNVGTTLQQQRITSQYWLNQSVTPWLNRLPNNHSVEFKDIFKHFEEAGKNT